MKYYTVIVRTPDFDNMHYINVLEEFKTDYGAYFLLEKKTSPSFPLVSDKDKEKKIIKCAPLF